MSLALISKAWQNLRFWVIEVTVGDDEGIGSWCRFDWGFQDRRLASLFVLPLLCCTLPAGEPRSLSNDKGWYRIPSATSERSKCHINITGASPGGQVKCGGDCRRFCSAKQVWHQESASLKHGCHTGSLGRVKRRCFQTGPQNTEPAALNNSISTRCSFYDLEQWSKLRNVRLPCL